MQTMLKGGQVMDVRTGEVAPGDVLIEDERIVAVGRRRSSAAKTARPSSTSPG